VKVMMLRGAMLLAENNCWTLLLLGGGKGEVQGGEC
jgi:hypothetical protein